MKKKKGLEEMKTLGRIKTIIVPDGMKRFKGFLGRHMSWEKLNVKIQEYTPFGCQRFTLHNKSLMTSTLMSEC